ncbi:MAG: hypothetical protein K2X32_06370 [Phycisphaerales bacterium]|nr:hypothetical protein [Phycisphaerales bacterium]
MLTSPLNILHVLEPSVDGHDAMLGVLACVQNLGGPGVRHMAILLGSRDDELDAQALGLTLTDRVTTPHFDAASERLIDWTLTQFRQQRSIARIVRARHEQVGGIDGVVCWSAGRAGRIADVVSQVCGPRTPVIAMLTRGPRETDRDTLWPHVGTGGGRVRVACMDEDIASAWRAAGVQRAEVLVAPAVQLDSGDENTFGSPESQRQRLRAELSIRPDEIAVGLLCDPATFGEARLFAWIMGVLAISGRTCVGIAPQDASSMRRAARYLRLHHRHWEIATFRRPGALAMRAADIVIWDTDPARVGVQIAQPPSGQLSALSVASMGIPIVTVASGLTRRTLVGAPGWCRVGNASMPSLGAGVLPLADDPALRATVGAAIARAVDAPARNRAFGDALESLLRDATMSRQRAGEAGLSAVAIGSTPQDCASLAGSDVYAKG